jgi:hypothetical protein
LGAGSGITPWLRRRRAPNLRPGDGVAIHRRAFRYDPELSLAVLFEELLVDAASIINASTAQTYRYDSGHFID